MTRLEQIHALLRRLECRKDEHLSDPTNSADCWEEITAQLHEVREMFSEELARVLSSLKGELYSPRELLSNPRELRSALSRALRTMDPEVPELMSDSLDRASLSLLS